MCAPWIRCTLLPHMNVHEFIQNLNLTPEIIVFQPLIPDYFAQNLIYIYLQHRTHAHMIKHLRQECNDVQMVTTVLHTGHVL